MESKLSPQAIQTWATLFKTYRSLLDGAEKKLKQAGLPPLSWYDVLWEVYREPGRRLRQYEIGERILLSKYNLSRLLDRLEGQNLIVKEPCARDKRGYYISITAAGIEMLDNIWQVYREIIHDNFARLYSPQETEQLHELLQRVLDRE